MQLEEINAEIEAAYKNTHWSSDRQECLKHIIKALVMITVKLQECPVCVLKDAAK